MMKATIKLFLVLITVVVVVIGWITGQYREREFFILILALICATLATFLAMNIHDHKVQARKRKERESRSHEDLGEEAKKIQRSEGSFALKERKSGLSWGGGNIKASASDKPLSFSERKQGLTWGGGNIKASTAERGTRRKFLGK